MTFMFCDVHADPNPTDGTAYAVLTDNSNGQEAGELIFFRSENEYGQPLDEITVLKEE